MRISISLNSQRSVAEIQGLPPFSTYSAEEVYKLSKQVYIDNINGMGQTPDNRNVLYKGFLSILSLKSFLSLAEHSSDAEERSRFLIEQIHAGFGIGNPCFYIDVDSYMDDVETKDIARITGHEGRARCTALQHFKITEMPIQFFLVGYRARHVLDKDHFLKYLNRGIRDQNGKIQFDVFEKLIFG